MKISTGKKTSKAPEKTAKGDPKAPEKTAKDVNADPRAAMAVMAVALLAKSKELRALFTAFGDAVSKLPPGVGDYLREYSGGRIPGVIPHTSWSTLFYPDLQRAKGKVWVRDLAAQYGHLANSMAEYEAPFEELALLTPKTPKKVEPTEDKPTPTPAKKRTSR